MGLPEDVLAGDPTGRLFDLVNSMFFIAYVRMAPAGSESLSPRVYTDYLSNTFFSMLENGFPSHLDRRSHRWLGSLLYFDGVPPSIFHPYIWTELMRFSQLLSILQVLSLLG